MTGIYRRFIEPALVSLSCGAPAIARERARIVPEASGIVLEIGFGSGHNLPFYAAENVSKLIALEPSREMRARAKRRLAASPLRVEIIKFKAEDIPLDAASVDTIVMTYTLCTIPEPLRALGAMRRVLKKDGRLLFSEHGLSPDPEVARWQRRLNRLWGAIGGGCNLNRDTESLLRAGGFAPERLHKAYLKGAPKFAGYNASGVARIA